MRRGMIGLLAGVVFGCSLPSAVRVEAPMATAMDRRAAFALAYDAFRDGDDERARALFAALEPRYPEVADHCLYFLGVLQRRAGDDRDAGRTFTRLLDTYPQSVHAAAAALEHGRLLQRAGRDSDARDRLQRALQASDAPTRNAARLALAEADLRGGAIELAYREFAGVRRDAPDSAAGRTARQHLFELRSRYARLQPRGAELLEEGRLLLEEGDAVTAQQVAERLLVVPEGIDVAEAERLRADALYQQGRLEEAYRALWETADRYPRSPAGRAALLRMAQLLWNKDRDEAARRAFVEFLDRYPAQRGASDALYAIGRIHETAGRNREALRSFDELTRRFPRSHLVREARWRIGWIHYRNGDWVAAERGFANLARLSTGTDRQTGLYWQARSLEQAGRGRAASKLYERLVAGDGKGYYGALAERRLRGDTNAVRFRASDEAPHPTPQAQVFAAPEFAGVDDTFHLSRWRELREAGVFSLARAELAVVHRAHADDGDVLRDLLRAYPGVDGFYEALRLVYRIGGRVRLSPFDRERALYPLAFWDVVRDQGAANGVDPLLIESIMRQESLFDPDARSPADARGLMQLLPSTAERMASGGGPGLDPAALNVPEVNVRLGAKYLRALLRRYRGDVVKALAAYNGGEAAVEKWERRAPDLETDEFVENISYRETREYVKRVLGNYQVYRSIYRPS